MLPPTLTGPSPSVATASPWLWPSISSIWEYQWKPPLWAGWQGSSTYRLTTSSSPLSTDQTRDPLLTANCVRNTARQFRLLRARGVVTRHHTSDWSIVTQIFQSSCGQEEGDIDGCEKIGESNKSLCRREIDILKLNFRMYNFEIIGILNIKDRDITRKSSQFMVFLLRLQHS